MRGLAKPTSYPRNNRIAPTERRTLELHGVYLTQYKIESDGDIHTVMKDTAGRVMIAELPLDACVPTSSRSKRPIAVTRATFIPVGQLHEQRRFGLCRLRQSSDTDRCCSGELGHPLSARHLQRSGSAGCIGTARYRTMRLTGSAP